MGSYLLLHEKANGASEVPTGLMDWITLPPVIRNRCPTYPTHGRQRTSSVMVFYSIQLRELSARCRAFSLCNVIYPNSPPSVGKQSYMSSSICVPLPPAIVVIFPPSSTAVESQQCLCLCVFVTRLGKRKKNQIKRKIKRNLSCVEEESMLTLMCYRHRLFFGWHVSTVNFYCSDLPFAQLKRKNPAQFSSPEFVQSIRNNDYFPLKKKKREGTKKFDWKIPDAPGHLTVSHGMVKIFFPSRKKRKKKKQDWLQFQTPVNARVLLGLFPYRRRAK